MPTSHLEQAGRFSNDNRFSRSVAAVSLAMLIAVISSTNAFDPASSKTDLSASINSSTAKQLWETKQKMFDMAIPFSFCFDEFAQPQCHYPLEATNT